MIILDETKHVATFYYKVAKTDRMDYLSDLFPQLSRELHGFFAENGMQLQAILWVFATLYRAISPPNHFHLECQ